MSVIGEKIKQYRTEKGYTQEQLGRIIALPSCWGFSALGGGKSPHSRSSGAL